MPLSHFADRLTEAVRKCGNSLCVGLDPRWDRLPLSIREKHGCESLVNVAAAYEEFCRDVIDIVADQVAVVKPQAAFFEACGPQGMVALQTVLEYAKGRNLVAILDGKRNDIASTAEAYADAAFGGVKIDGKSFPVWNADALTVNPYLGRDAVEPFLKSARRDNRGVFVLVRTSNPGAGIFQDLICNGKPLYQHVADAVANWGRENWSASGMGDVGAVVGATHPAELKQLRRVYRDVWFLIPGFGAQGGTAAAVAAGFRADGLGAIVNSSRGIISSFDPADSCWQEAVKKATQETITALRSQTPMGDLRS